jgi:phage I-like protein
MMASMKPDARPIAALNLEIALDATGGVPQEAHLLPAGRFRSEDGRPRDVAHWIIDAAIAQAVILRIEARRGDVVIDYEHQSLNTEYNGQIAPAAGWFRVLEWRDDGLYATGIRWTDRARKMIAAREYRYISAVFAYLPGSGEVLEILSVGLTNTPALDGLTALVAARKTNPLTQEEAMDEKAEAALKTEIAAFLTDAAAQSASIAALTKERDEMKAKLAAIEEKEKQAALTAEKKERDALLEKVPPALKASLEKMPIAALKEFVEKSAPLGILSRQTDGRAAPATAALTKEEAAFCEKMGVTHEAFLKAKE